MAFEHCNDSHSEGLKERVRGFMRTYQINLEQFSDLLGAERARVASWLVGAAPAPQILTRFCSHSNIHPKSAAALRTPHAMQSRPARTKKPVARKGLSACARSNFG